MNTAGNNPSSHPLSATPAANAGVPPSPYGRGGRIPKLDLLLHLLANLHQPIMLLGPKGAGKTALLRQIQGHAHDSWKVCYVLSTANLSFGRILDEICQLLQKPGQSSPNEDTEAWLEEQLTAFARQDRSLVLLLDNAGILMPGLLDALCGFVRRHPALRLAFTLCPEDIGIKTATDAPAVNDSHVVHLSSPTDADPGVIPSRPTVESSQRPPHQASSNAPKLLLASGILLAILAASAVALLLQRGESEPQSAAIIEPTSEVIRPPAANTVEIGSGPTSVASSPVEEGSETGASIVNSTTSTSPPPATLESPIQPSEANTATRPPAVDAAPTKTPDPGKNTSAALESKESIQERPLTPEEKPKLPPPAQSGGNLTSGLKDGDWLMQQNPNAYTLQVVAVSRFDALVKFAEQIPAGSELATFRSRKGNGALYPLFYGLYPNLATAKEASDRWPPTLGRPYPRQLKSIQYEIQRMAPKKAEPTPPPQ